MASSNGMVRVEFSAYSMDLDPGQNETVGDCRRRAVDAWGMPDDAKAHLNNDGSVDDDDEVVAGDLVRFYKQNAVSGK